MSEAQTTWRSFAGAVERHRGMVLPLMVAAMVFVVLVPLPPAVMDVLLAANIALSAIIMLTAIRVASPLEFSVLPSVLLGATLLRLVLNVATTRLILTACADGRTLEQARVAAGRVVWTFSDFVASGSLAVGAIIFAILVVVQFVVITKGAGRISEVAARFVLDAMPGKQMAVDSDLKAGLITDDQARARRSEISREADFYGAMDGASKFVRGDAVAAVIITLVNIVGGLYIGMVQYGWSWDQTLELYTRLTIGDGLVTQIPALLVSTAAALLITRSPARADLGEQVVSQLTSRPAAIGMTAGFLCLLALTPLPTLPLLALAAVCGGLAWTLRKRETDQNARREADRGEMPSPASSSASASYGGAKSESSELPETAPAVDPLRVDVGYALVRMFDGPRRQEMLSRLDTLRRQLADELGLVTPGVKLADDLRLGAHEYVIRVRGAKVAGGSLRAGRLLAVAGEHVVGTLEGQATEDPVFGAPAVWISAEQRRNAERMGYAVVEPAEVLLMHLSAAARRHAAELLSRSQVARMMEGLQARSGLSAGQIAGKLTLGQIQKVLQGLLREGVPIRDVETILEAAGDAAEQADRLPAGRQGVDEIVEQVRAALGATISQQCAGADGKLVCVCLDTELEKLLRSHLHPSGAMAMPPATAARVATSVAGALGAVRAQGRRPVVLCSPSIRGMLRDVLTPAAPDAAVLGYNEVRSVEVQSLANVGMPS